MTGLSDPNAPIVEIDFSEPSDRDEVPEVDQVLESTVRMDQVDLDSIQTRGPKHRLFVARWLGLGNVERSWAMTKLPGWAVDYLQARAVTPRSALVRGIYVATNFLELPEKLPETTEGPTGQYLCKGSWTKSQVEHLENPNVEVLVIPWFRNDDDEAMTFELKWNVPRQAPAGVDKDGKQLTRPVKTEFAYGVADGSQPGDIPIDSMPFPVKENDELSRESAVYDDAGAMPERECPVLLTEGVFKGDAMAAQAALEGWQPTVFSMRGVWQGLVGAADRPSEQPKATPVLLPLILAPGAAYLVFDPDWRENPHVRNALIATAEVIERESFNDDRRVYVVDIPPVPGVNGIDDYLASKRVTDPNADYLLDLLSDHSIPWRVAEQQTHIHEQTDMGRSDRVAAECAALGHRYHPGLGWLTYNDGLFEPFSNAAIAELAKGLVRRIIHPAGKKETRSARLTAQSAAALRNAVQGATTVATVRVAEDDLDADPNLLNTKNGVVDLMTGELLPHSPLYLMTSMATCGYWPGAFRTSMHWRVFLRQTLVEKDGVTYDPELAEQMQILAGSWLFGENHEKFAVLIGGGGNGKSVFMSAIAGVLGKYSGAINPAALVGGGNQFSEADVYGKRLVLASETAKGQKLNEAVMKRLSSSEDPIRVEHKGRQAFYARPTHSLVMATNNAPRMLSLDMGVRRRMIFVPFNAVVPIELQNGRISEDLSGEREAILDWLVEGAVKFADKRKVFLISPASSAANEDFFSANDPLTEFFEDCLEATGKDTDRIIRGDLLKAYSSHSLSSSNRRPLGAKSFYKAMRERKYNEVSSNGLRYFVGLKLSAAATHSLRNDDAF